MIFNYHLIIQHPIQPQILLLPQGSGWALPHLKMNGPAQSNWWRETARLNRDVQEFFGLNVTTLEVLDVSEEKPSGQPVGMFVLENHSVETAQPLEGVWVGVDELKELQFIHPEHLALVQSYLARDLHSFNEKAPAWTKPGWFAKVATWIDQRLEEIRPFREPEHNLVLTGPLEQVRSWFLSCILRQPTNEGMLYFKAAPSYYSYEPLVTAAVASQQPRLAPTVLGVDLTEGWLLMQGIEGKRLDQAVGSARYLEHWQNLLTDFAHLQISLADYPFQSVIGLPNWRPADLPDRLEALLSTFAGLLGEAELEELQNRLPALKAACDTLATSTLLLTLHHGDLHSGNILATEDTYRLLDWAGFCALSHPFLSMTVPFYEELTEPALRNRLRQAYLVPWQARFPDKDLVEVFETALPVGLLCGILGHAQQLNQGTKSWEKAQEEGNLTYYLKLLSTVQL